jgi:3-oxoacyl-[acyl-carrier protein] reductase
MDLELQNKVAMVSAASKGIGKGIAKSLLREGCSVSICARSRDTLEAAQNELQKESAIAEVLAVPCDVSKLEDLQNWYNITRESLGKVDILVTNTGGPPPGQFIDLTDEQWKAGVDSTLMNVVRLCRMVLPEMQEQKWGRIVHVTSLAAKQPVDILSISNTLRAGISALTKTLSNQYASDNITVNALLPGHISTDRQIQLNEVNSKKLGITVEKYAEKVKQGIPAKRYGTTQEIGDVAAFLCSERATYLAGVSLQVDGGIIAGTF